jgi:hypothetical protein
MHIVTGPPQGIGDSCRHVLVQLEERHADSRSGSNRSRAKSAA